MMTVNPPRAAIYARLSLDRDGTAVSVDRQLDDCRALAERKGWAVVAEHRDDSRSAWKRDRKRPGWDALLAGIQGGIYDAVVVWHGDRLVRQPFDLEQLIGLVEQRGLPVASASGTRDLGNADDRFILRIETAAACRESDSTARRVTRARADAAVKGERHGFTPYGWRTESERKTVVRIVKALISGESLRSTTITLNAEGAPAPRGGIWSSTQVRQIASRASNAGLRTYRGEIVSDGVWEPLIAREDYEAVSALLRDPTRRTNAGKARRHLLSGLARCGTCGGTMRYALTGVRGREIYRCENLHLSIHYAELDEFVVAVITERLSRGDAADLLTPSGDGTRAAVEQIDSVRARLDGAADDYAAGLIDRAQLLRITSRLKPELQAAETAAAASRRGSVLEGIPPGRRARGVVARLSLPRKRALIDALLIVRVLPAVAYTRGFKPERVAIEWRKADD